MAPLHAVTPNRTAMLAANAQYAATRSDDLGKLDLPPTKKYLIITCIDARIDPAAAFGINLGEAHVIRNAGGSAVAALRDIIISTHFLGVTEVFIIKHKNCGMSVLESVKKPILQQLYPTSIVCPGACSIIDMPFYEFECPYAAVRADWFFVQNHPAIRAQDASFPDRDIVIHGLVYDPVTGKLEDVPPRVDPSENPIPGSQPNGPDPGTGGGGGGGGQRGANDKTPTQPSEDASKLKPPTTTPTRPPKSSRKSTDKSSKSSGGVTKSSSSIGAKFGTPVDAKGKKSDAPWATWGMP